MIPAGSQSPHSMRMFLRFFSIDVKTEVILPAEQGQVIPSHRCGYRLEPATKRTGQVRPVPLPEVSARLVRALAKFEQRLSGRVRRAHVVVHQEKLAHLFAIKSFNGAHWAITKSRGLRRGIRIESRVLHFSAAWPKSHADDFVGIGLPGDAVGTGAFRRAPSGKSRNRKIKTPPKEMHRADFS